MGTPQDGVANQVNLVRPTVLLVALPRLLAKTLRLGLSTVALGGVLDSRLAAYVELDLPTSRFHINLVRCVQRGREPLDAMYSARAGGPLNVSTSYARPEKGCKEVLFG